MSKKIDLSSLNVTTAIGYFASGVALSVSYTQMSQIFKQQGGVTGSDYVSVALPIAILLGASAIWRMLAHLYSRYGGSHSAMAFAFMFLGLSAFVTEGVSITTSAMAISLGVNEKAVQSDGSDQAISEAIRNLSASMSALPDNYITKRNETAGRIQALLEAQSGKREVKSATQKTFDDFGDQFGLTGDRMQTIWAWIMAICLSLILIAHQVFTGSLNGAKGGSIAKADSKKPKGHVSP